MCMSSVHQALTKKYENILEGKAICRLESMTLLQMQRTTTHARRQRPSPWCWSDFPWNRFSALKKEDFLPLALLYVLAFTE
jgi:hypothetical protein